MSKLKFTALAASLTVLAGATAHAGGYTPPVAEPAVAPVLVEPAPSMNWQGGYIGATLGYAFGGDDVVGITDTTTTPETYVTDIGNLDGSGANFGIRAGYMWQNNNWVFGPELGFEITDIKGDTSGTINGIPADADTKIKNVLALRFKAGYTVQPDTLVYGIAGWARADIDYNVMGEDLGYDTDGYILGLGVEKRLNEQWSVTGEYEYADFGKDTLYGSVFSTEATPKYSNIKLGLNFRF